MRFLRRRGGTGGRDGTGGGHGGRGAAETGGSDILTRAAPPPDRTLTYGPHPDHVVDLWLPANPRTSGDPAAGRAKRPGSRPEDRPAPLVVVLHGGFWRAEYDRSHSRPMAAALAAAGYAVAVPEYRRAGQRGGGWPGTFDDVAAAVDALPGLLALAGIPVPYGPAVLAGHSAGGHLALWAAARHRLDPSTHWHRDQDERLAVVALAAVSDLRSCAADGLGDGAARNLLGGPPERHPDRYAATDPARLVPLGAAVSLVHGTADDRVPVAMSRAYAARARAAGDQVTLTELPGADHFAVIDPRSAAWPAVLDAVARHAAPPG